MKVYFTRGLPASGKSTWARERCAETGAVRVNMDAIRLMSGQPWSPEHEKFCQKLQKQIVLQVLREGKDVIIDNTHLNTKMIKPIVVEIWECGFDVDYEIVDFLDVPWNVCYARNDRRTGSEGYVPQEAMDRMLKQSLKPSVAHWTMEDLTAGLPKVVPYVPNDKLYPAVLVDVDGTLANATTRGPYDFDRCGEDELHTHVRDFVNGWGMVRAEWLENPFIIVMSGRESKYRSTTIYWLDKHEVTWDILLMRKEGDTRRDSVIKYELFDTKVRDNYNVVAALDDRLRCIRLWHQLGIPTLRVGPPDADF